VGLQEALKRGATYVLLLNNDTWVESHCFARLVEVAEANPTAGLLGPRIYYYQDPNVVWMDGGVVKEQNGCFLAQLLLRDQKPVTPPDGHREVDFVACAVLIRRDVVERIGGFDPRFYAYWDDVDLCLRARRAGYKVLTVPAATVHHKVSRTFGVDSPDNYYYYRRNQYLVSAKQTRIGQRLPLHTSHLRQCFWEYCSLAAGNQPEQAVAVADAAWHALISRYGKRGGHAPRLVVALMERLRMHHQPFVTRTI
jgi:GT2 family glycosyltransferase